MERDQWCDSCDDCYEPDCIDRIEPKPKKYRKPEMDSRVNLSHSDAVKTGKTCICLEDHISSVVMIGEEVISLGKLMGFEKIATKDGDKYAPIYEATRGQ